MKIADTLEQNNIHYETDIRSHMIFVAQNQNVEARMALARAGMRNRLSDPIPRRSIQDICMEWVEGLEPMPELTFWQGNLPVFP